MTPLRSLITINAPLVTAIELPIALTNGNDGRGSKWFKTAKLRDELEARLRASRKVFEPLPFPVLLLVTRLLGKGQRLWDYSSCGRGSWKELEDAMVACGWFTDDSPPWIVGCLFDQRKDKGRISAGVLVEIFKANNSKGELLR